MLSFSVASSVRDSGQPQKPLRLLRAVVLSVVPDQQRHYLDSEQRCRRLDLTSGSSSLGWGPGLLSCRELLLLGKAQLRFNTLRELVTPRSWCSLAPRPWQFTWGKARQGRKFGRAVCWKGQAWRFQDRASVELYTRGCRGRPSCEECFVHKGGGLFGCSPFSVARVLLGLNCSN